MSLLFMDGFEVADWNTGKYDAFSAGGSSSAATRYGTGLCYSGSVISGTPYFRKTFPAANKVIVGFAYKINSLSDAGALVWFNTDAAASNQIQIRHTAGGGIFIIRGAANGVAQSAPNVIPVNTWAYIEVSAIAHASAGEVIVRVNGVQVTAYTGNTRNIAGGSGIDTVSLVSQAGQSVQIDDLYICNGLGSVNNNFLGEVRVQGLKPNGVGSVNQLTPVGVANNWDNVNEVTPSAADYNYSSTAGHQDLYALEDLWAGSSAVLGVQAVAAARKTDAAARSVKNLIKRGASTAAGPPLALSATAMYAETIYETDPTTGLPWAVADIAALEAGVEVV